ncbi:hypothetical protein, partial [Lactobacillus jensenii]|uniref:hypothetical protein n=2 Tax=Lactobacillus jensenii TaxID=109790 RepID=UPI0028E53A73
PNLTFFQGSSKPRNLTFGYNRCSSDYSLATKSDIFVSTQLKMENGALPKGLIFTNRFHIIIKEKRTTKCEFVILNHSRITGVLANLCD